MSEVFKDVGENIGELIIMSSDPGPQGWIAATIKPGPAQAYVIAEGSTLNNTFMFVLWLMPDGTNWQVEDFEFVPASMVGQYPEDLHALAEAQQKESHNFNAFILYETALQLTNRGPDFQLGIQPEIQNKLGSIPVPHELQGNAPYTWNFGGSMFQVLNVGPIGVAGKIYLEIDHEVDPWTDDKVVDTKNHELITAFAKMYPEYKDAFAGIVIKAHERGSNQTFGTVEVNPK